MTITPVNFVTSARKAAENEPSRKFADTYLPQGHKVRSGHDHYREVRAVEEGQGLLHRDKEEDEGEQEIDGDADERGPDPGGRMPHEVRHIRPGFFYLR